MYYFENDPLQSVYDDLADGKTDTHFDKVLKLKGLATEDFNLAVANQKKEIPEHKPKRFVGSRSMLRPK